MYFRYTFLIFFCCCITLCATAQQLFTVGGIVYKKNYTDRIAQINVTNINRKTAASTDNFGVFHIQVAKGDTLLFKKTDYTTQFFVISGTYDINIYMQPVYMLNEVTVKEQSKRQELADVMSQYRKEGTFANGKPKALSFLASPLTGMYELFGKTPNRARHFKEYSKDELEHIEISKKYNKGVVKQITNMPDEELEPFMNAFTPSYQDIIAWNDYDIINYVRKSYEYYKNNKGQLQLQKLY